MDQAVLQSQRPSVLSASRPWILLAVVWSVNLLTNWNRNLVAPLASGLMADLNLDHTQVLSLQSAPALVTVFLSIPAGLLADRLGVRRAILLALALTGTLALARGLAATYAQVLMLTVLFGLGSPLAMPALAKMVRRSFPAKRTGLATGIYHSGFGLGITMALATTYPLFGFDWRLAFVVMGLATFLPAVLWWFVSRQARPLLTMISPPGLSLEGLGSAARSWNVWTLGGARFFTLGGAYLALGLLPLALERVHHLSPGQAGAVTSVVGVGALLGNLLTPALSDWLQVRKPLLWLGSLVAAACLFLTWWLGASPLAQIFALMVGLAAGGGMAVSMTMLTEYQAITSQSLGTSIGLTEAMTSAGQLVLPILGGIVVDVTGSYTLAFGAAATMLLLAAGCGLLTRETWNKEQEVGR